MKTKTVIVTMLSLLIAGSFVLARAGEAKAALTAQEKAFMRAAASDGIMDVEFGKTAMKEAQAPDVKAFAARMVRDHSKANSKLKALAGKEELKLPSRLSLKDKAVLQELIAVPKADFEKRYMTLMVKDHAKDIVSFQDAQKTVQDPDLKDWIDDTLPVLKKHFDMARKIAQRMGIDVNKAEQEGKDAAQ